MRTWPAYDVAAAAVETLDAVSEVYSISGAYDLMLKCYLNDGTDIGHFVTERVQTLAGVKNTCTTIAFKAFA
jgi:DNA-binding Lrp family transcriptional regulator